MPILLFLLLLAVVCSASGASSGGGSFSSSSVYGEESERAADSVASPMKNIPLPRQTAYTGKGFSLGLGAGLYSPTDDCDCVGIWQGQLEYFYSPTVSGGVDVRFLGGDLDTDVMVMYQRYRVNVRIHKLWDKLDLYLEPVLGLENTSIEEFRDQVKAHNSDIREDGWFKPDDAFPEDSSGKKSAEDCEKMFSLDGFSLGVGVGLGYLLTEYMGVTGSVLLEYNFSRAIQLTMTPGVALDLQRIWPWARNNLLSTWMSLEIGVQRYFNRGVDDWASYGFAGIQLGI